MIIDVSGILKEFGGKINIDGEIALNDESVVFGGPVKIKGSVYNNGKSLTLKAECEGVLKTQCARCLKDIDANVQFPVEENFVQSDGETAAEDVDITLFEGHTLEIDGAVLEAFFLNTSMKYLCKEDCKGLCQNCGADLNEGDCGCNHDIIDPRWAGLADMLNKNEE